MVIFVVTSFYAYVQIYQYIIDSYLELIYLHLKNNRYYHLSITYDLIHEVIPKCGFFSI